MNTPRPAIVESHRNEFWCVRYGPGVAEVEYLRPWQFRFSATNPQRAPDEWQVRRWDTPPETTRQDGRAIWPGQHVELHYEITGRSGFWFAYPLVQP